MKKFTPLYFTLAVLSISVMLGACGSKFHDTNVTPSNIRIQSMIKTTTRAQVVPPEILPQITESFSFQYDAYNRLSYVLYSSNDSTKFNRGVANQAITYTYYNDTILRVATSIHTSKVIERDTFVQNGLGQIITSFTPWEIDNFQYFGNLLTKESNEYVDTSGITITANSTFTSNSGDFLQNIQAATIDASVSTLSAPLNFTWAILAGTADTIYHPGIGSTTDAITDNTIFPIFVYAEDQYSNFTYGYYPGNYGTNTYVMYNGLYNRTGDYLQLESFLKYGMNIYQNAHLVHTITNVEEITTASYVIDAQSKVTSTSVNIKDVTANTTNVVYNLTYQTY